MKTTTSARPHAHGPLQAALAWLASAAACVAMLATPATAQAASAPPTPTLSKSVQLSDSSYPIDVSKDGSTAIVREDDKISFINIDSGEKKQVSASNLNATELSEDGKTLFVADGHAITAYDVRTATPTPLNNLSLSDDVYRIFSGKDSRTIAVATSNDESKLKVQIYDLKSQQVTDTRDVGEASSLLVSKDMKTVYTSKDGDKPTIEALSIKDGTVKYTKSFDQAEDWNSYGVYFSSQLDDGTLIAGDGGQRFYRVSPDDGTVEPLSQQNYLLLGYNSDFSKIAVIQSDTKSLSDSLSESDMDAMKLVVYDGQSGKELSTANITGKLTDAIKSGPSSSGSTLSYDGRHLYMFGSNDSGASSSQMDTIDVYDTKTGANSSTVLPDGMDAYSWPILADSDSKLVTVTYHDGDYRLSVFDTHIRMNMVDAYKQGGNPLLIILIALAVVAIIAIVVLLLALRARKQGKQLFGFLKPKGGAPAAGTAGAPVAPPALFDAQGNPLTPPVGGMPPVPGTFGAPGAPTSPVTGIPAAPIAPVPGAPAPVAPTVPAPSPAPVPAAPAPVPTAPVSPAVPSPSPAPAAASGAGFDDDATQLGTTPAPSPAPKFCGHCGNPIANPNARFCPKCGNPITR